MSDALSALVKAQQQPKMQPIPFATESAEGDSNSATLERLVNLYAEVAPPGARSKITLRSTPGLLTTNVFGTGPVLAMNSDLPGRLYVVSGTRLIRQTDTSVDDMGDVGSPTASYSSIVTIATGPTQVVVCVPPRAYGARVDETALHPITGTTDSPFPGASSVAYIDGYFVFTADENSSRFFTAKLLDPNSFDALDFAYSDATPNVIRRVVEHLERLWFMGESAIEIWYNSGDLDFPFRRDFGGVIPYGVMSPKSVAICDGSVFWLATNGMVMRNDGYKAARVSTHAIETRIHNYLGVTGTPSLGIGEAFSFTDDGHPFYVLTLTKQNDPGLTLLLDCATKLWHERSSDAGGSGRWRPNCAALSGQVVLGDSASGAVFQIAPASSQEAGVDVPRIAVSPPISNASRRATMDCLEIVCELGGSPLVLDYTDDAGATWRGDRTLNLSGKRARTNRLGSFYQRTLRLRTTGRVRIFEAEAQITSAVA